jgi:radical SAM superfamily enzyme YgiQ (UPF0313 family)
MKGKVLLIVHDVYQDDNEFPLGIGYLASVLVKAGHSVEIYSQDVFHYTNEELVLFLDSHSFDMIGIGFRSARYVETIRPLIKVANEHKKNAKIVLGGAGFTPIPEYILNDTKSDIGVLGEGEKIIVTLLEAILNNSDLSKIKGIAFRNGNKITITEREEPIKNLDEIPFPAWDLFPMEEYATCLNLIGGNKDRTFSLVSSRGCINKCSFCYRLEKGIRLRSMNNLFEEMKILVEKYGINYFYFRDEMLFPNKKRIKEFVKMIKKLKITIKFCFPARVELGKDKEILKMLKNAGCQEVSYGIESLDQNVLNLMGKNVTVEDNYTAIRNTIESGMNVGMCFIWGNEGDTLESLNKIVDFLLNCENQSELRTIRPPTPYPGSPIYYKAIKEGQLKDTSDFFDKFKNSERIIVNFTKLSNEEIHLALFEANSKLIRNYFNKKGESTLKAEEMIESFKRVYFPKNEEDLKFRGARHYNNKTEIKEKIKLNVGASTIWSSDGWKVLDHKIKEDREGLVRGEATNIKLEDNSCSLLFCSHMIEHIPYNQIQKVLLEVSRVLEIGGTIRILTPDLKRLAKAYVEDDREFYKKLIEQYDIIPEDLGYGGVFMNFMISSGQDTILLNRNMTEFLGGYAHLYSYDFEMLKILLSSCGFGLIEQKEFCESSIPDFNIPLHVKGLKPEWHPFNKEFCKKNNLIHEYKDGNYNINFKTTGFDKTPIESLIVEAKKIREVKLEDMKLLNYDPYSSSILYDENVRNKLGLLGIKVDKKYG